MLWPFRSNPDPNRLRVDWHMVRLTFTTKDGWAYLAQTIILFGTMFLAALFGWRFLKGWDWGDLGLALWFWLLVVWPQIREGIRFGRW